MSAGMVPDQAGTENVDSLYPLRYAARRHHDAVLRRARHPTAAKAGEIVALREQVLELYGDWLAESGAAMARSFAAGGRLFSFGDGGSGTAAQQVAHLFRKPGPGARPLPARPLTADLAMTAGLASDVAGDTVLTRQLAAVAWPGDIAVGLSADGDSENILRAFAEAWDCGMLTVGLAGHEGGRMAHAGTIDYLFVVPPSLAQPIQEVQVTVCRVLRELTERALNALDGE